MKKVSRFAALSKGLNIITAPIKRNQVNNLIEQGRLQAEVKLAEIDAKIEDAARDLVANPKSEFINKLSDLMQTREDYVKAISLSQQIKDYLEEEIEVEEEKKK